MDATREVRKNPVVKHRARCAFAGAGSTIASVLRVACGNSRDVRGATRVSMQATQVRKMRKSSLNILNLQPLGQRQPERHDNCGV